MRVEVEVRSVFGVPKIYPANEAARLIAEIAGQRTLNPKHLDKARLLGHEIVEVNPPKLGVA